MVSALVRDIKLEKIVGEVKVPDLDIVKLIGPDLKTEIKVFELIKNKNYVTAKDLYKSTYEVNKNNNFEAGCYGAWCNCNP